jgi:hypothetical protein
MPARRSRRICSAADLFQSSLLIVQDFRGPNQ